MIGLRPVIGTVLAEVVPTSQGGRREGTVLVDGTVRPTWDGAASRTGPGPRSDAPA
jgi:hypothetical protein